MLNKLIAWQRNSFIDFPSTVSTVLFFASCNLRCPYCHNVKIVHSSYQPIDFQEFLQFLDKREGLIEGVVLTGGEPTLCDLSYVINEIKGRHYKIKLDTNGLLLCEQYNQKILKDIDYLALDVKTSPRLYTNILRSPYSNNKERLQEAIEISKTIKSEIRTTLIRGLIDESICHEIGKMIEGSKQLYLQKQNMFAKNVLDESFMKNLEQFTDEEINKFVDIFSQYVEKCNVR